MRITNEKIRLEIIRLIVWANGWSGSHEIPENYLIARLLRNLTTDSSPFNIFHVNFYLRWILYFRINYNLSKLRKQKIIQKHYHYDGRAYYMFWLEFMEDKDPAGRYEYLKEIAKIV